MAGPSLMATLGANIAPFLQDLEQAKGKAKSEGEGIASALGEKLGEKVGTLLGAAGLEETIRQTVEWGDHVADLALRLGISTDAVQQWDYALKQNGSSIEAAVPFFEKLGIAREKALKGNEETIASFEKLGVSIDQLKTLRIEDVAAVIAHAFELGDPQELIASLREVGGKGAGQMAAAFRDGLSEALKEAPLVSAQDIANLKEASSAWTQLKAEFQSSIAPLVASISEGALATIDFARSALAIPIGALNGLVEAFGKVHSLKDLLKFIFGGGALTAGFEGMQEGLDAVSQQQVARDAAAEARRNRAQTPFTGFDAEGEGAGSRHKGEESGDEMLAREWDKTVSEMIDQQGEAYTDAAKRLDELRKEEKKFSELKQADYEVNALQKIGGFEGAVIQPGQIEMIEVQKKSEEHLAEIRKEMKRLTAILSQGPAGADDAQF